MKIGQIIFNTIGLFLACMMLVSIISMFFIVMPEYPDKHGWWHFLIAYEVVLLVTIGGGALANFAKGRLCGWPTGAMIAGYFMSGWLIPLAIWGIVLLVSEQRRQRTAGMTPDVQSRASVQ